MRLNPNEFKRTISSSWFVSALVVLSNGCIWSRNWQFNSEIKLPGQTADMTEFEGLGIQK